MAPKPASTAGKAPASTASKAPAKASVGNKAAKKTSTAKASEGGATDVPDKKKRKKTRKETYSSYIYKVHFYSAFFGLALTWSVFGSPQAGPPQHGYLEQGDGFLNSFVNDIFGRVATEASSKFVVMIENAI